MAENMALGYTNIPLGSTLCITYSQAAKRRFLEFLGHLKSCLFHSGYTTVERHEMFTFIKKSKACGSEGLDRPETVSFDTGHLDKACNRVTGHSEMMLQSHFRGVLDLCRCTAMDCTEACRSHGRCGTDFALTAYFGAGD